MDFQKDNATFPIKKDQIFLSHSGISPLYKGGAAFAQELLGSHMQNGHQSLFEHYENILEEFKNNFAELLKTSPNDIASVKNTSEAMSMIAAGYPFEPGDEIITFEQEYPANFYPWVLQEKNRGVVVRQLPNRPDESVPNGVPYQWLWKNLEQAVNSRTKIIALSHVQFTSGHQTDLHRLSDFCKSRDIDLIIDAAQGLGVIDIDLSSLHIAALAAPLWKWLLGPVGCGMMYVSEGLRQRLNQVIIGAETMEQGFDYTDHSWTPHSSAKRFEYSTSPIYLLGAMNVILREVHLKYGITSIQRETKRLREHFLKQLDLTKLTLPNFTSPTDATSSILSFYHPEAELLVEKLQEKRIVCSARGGYLRVAIHFYNDEEELNFVAKTFNEIL